MVSLLCCAGMHSASLRVKLQVMWKKTTVRVIAPPQPQVDRGQQGQAPTGGQGGPDEEMGGTAPPPAPPVFATASVPLIVHKGNDKQHPE